MSEVSFEDQGSAATQVQPIHSRFDRHGEGGDGCRAAIADQGWPYILERYAAAVR